MASLDHGVAPRHRSVAALRGWLGDHPGATTAEIAAAVFPGKITGPRRAEQILLVLRGQCHVRLDGERWYLT